MLHPARLAAMRDSQMLLARLYRREAMPRDWIAHAVHTARLCNQALVRLKEAS